MINLVYLEVLTIPPIVAVSVSIFSVYIKMKVTVRPSRTASSRLKNRKLLPTTSKRRLSIYVSPITQKNLPDFLFMTVID